MKKFKRSDDFILVDVAELMLNTAEEIRMKIKQRLLKQKKFKAFRGFKFNNIKEWKKG